MVIYMKNGNTISLNVSIKDVYDEIISLEKNNKKYLGLSNNQGMTAAININEIAYMGENDTRGEIDE